MNKLLNLNLKTHPYEIYYNGLVQWAKDRSQKRVLGNPPPKEIPPHIDVSWNEDEDGWAMFNHRLNQYVFDDFGVIGAFSTPEEARRWYRELI